MPQKVKLVVSPYWLGLMLGVAVARGAAPGRSTLGLKPTGTMPGPGVGEGGTRLGLMVPTTFPDLSKTHIRLPSGSVARSLPRVWSASQYGAKLLGGTLIFQPKS